ncbi:MAG: lysozyme inhibitor LprI family protein [Bacteroidota bacterium]
MLRLAASALILLFYTASAQAASPGFDCSKAVTVMDRLICADSGLAAMDQSMTNAFNEKRSVLPPTEAKALLQQQRDWIKRRNAACPMPPLTADQDFTLPQRWQLAPCVATQYRQRLAALGVVAPPVPPVAQRTDFIHPFCLGLAVMDDPPLSPIPLNACNKGNAHTPLEEGGGFLKAEGSSWGDTDTVSGGYKPLGKLRDGRNVFLTVFGYGGTGQFANIAAVTLKPLADGEVALSAEVIHAGGDRCMFGIDDAGLRNDALWVTKAITPADLMNADRARPYNPISEGLSGCAICCIGTATYVHPYGQQETLLSVRIDGGDELSSLEDERRPPPDRCVAKAVRASTPALPHDYTPGELRHLVKAIETCIRGN